MPLEIRPILKLTYKLRLGPQMRLSLNLLELPLVKLKEHVLAAAEENPLLELIINEPEWLRKKSSTPRTEEDEEKKEYMESLITKAPTLQEHLLRQLYLSSATKNERKIGESIIGNINDNGYLECSLEDIANLCNVAKTQAEKMLKLIQTFDPSGIGARDLRECLLLQLTVKQKENSLVGKIIDKYLPFLEKKRYEYIAKKLSAEDNALSCGKIPVSKIKEAMKEIAGLEPKPGRLFDAEKTITLIPDAVLRKNKKTYEVILNDWDLPRVILNNKYRKMLKQKDTPEPAKEYLKERLSAALGLISAIKRRKETIRNIIGDIVRVQKEFFDKGAANFKPMTLTSLAERIGKHKSTVSRAMNNKFLQTPQGIFELRHFLSSQVKQEGLQSISSKNIKYRLSEWIKNENKKKPLVDREIVDKFKKGGISVSRRVIAKYRGKLKILSSKSRQE